MPAILGKKAGMTSLYDDRGRQVPVTVIEAGPCQVLQVKTVETDGYNAVQLGYGEVTDRAAGRPLAGHARKAGATPKKVIREYRTDDLENYEPGGTVTVEAFRDVPMVDVTGVSKGRGFAGMVKRHGFKGQPASHGTKRKHQSAGSIGEGSGIPDRAVRKGKRMAGHMGHRRRTVERLELLKVDPDANLLLLKGSVPGPGGGYVFVRSASKMGAVKT